MPYFPLQWGGQKVIRTYIWFSGSIIILYYLYVALLNVSRAWFGVDVVYLMPHFPFHWDRKQEMIYRACIYILSFGLAYSSTGTNNFLQGKSLELFLFLRFCLIQFHFFCHKRLEMINRSSIYFLPLCWLISQLELTFLTRKKSGGIVSVPRFSLLSFNVSVTSSLKCFLVPV